MCSQIHTVPAGLIKIAKLVVWSNSQVAETVVDLTSLDPLVDQAPPTETLLKKKKNDTFINILILLVYGV